jgi:hypothetical protein
MGLKQILDQKKTHLIVSKKEESIDPVIFSGPSSPPVESFIKTKRTSPRVGGN